MPSTATTRALVVVALAAACLGTLLLVAFSVSAAAAPGDQHNDGTDHEQHSTVDAHVGTNIGSDAVSVDVKHDAEATVAVSVEAIDGDYPDEGSYELEPGETLELPAPESPTHLRVTAETDGATVVVRAAFEEYAPD